VLSNDNDCANAELDDDRGWRAPIAPALLVDCHCGARFPEWFYDAFCQLFPVYGLTSDV
jgi:hypothetical protein